MHLGICYVHFWVWKWLEEAKDFSQILTAFKVVNLEVRLKSFDSKSCVLSMHNVPFLFGSIGMGQEMFPSHTQALTLWEVGNRGCFHECA